MLLPLACLRSRKDVTTGKYLLRPLRWWAESAPLSWDRVKVSENLGGTAVAPVAPVVTSLKGIFLQFYKD